MTKLWQGIDNCGGCYYLSERDGREASGAFVGSSAMVHAEALWRLAQVARDKTHGYRAGIQEFVVDITTQAAMGRCVNNPSMGVGGAFQYFVPNWQNTMYKTGRTFMFDKEMWPC